MSASPSIITPCIGVCAIEPASGLCSGCGRTLDEIARWSRMTDAERALIMRELRARKAARLPACGV